MRPSLKYNGTETACPGIRIFFPGTLASCLITLAVLPAEGYSQKPEFGGLLPTSGQTTESTKMDKKDAAAKAWEDVGASNALAAANMGLE